MSKYIIEALGQLNSMYKLQEAKQQKLKNLTEAPDRFGIPTDDELDKDYQWELDELNKKRDARKEKTLSRRTKMQSLVNNIEDWINNNKSSLLKIQTELLLNPNILRVNTFNWESQVRRKTGLKYVTFRFDVNKNEFQIDDYIIINLLNASYNFDFKIDVNDYSAFDEAQRILTNLTNILNNLNIDNYIEETIKYNKQISSSAQCFINEFISQPDRITSIKQCDNPGHWACGGQFYIFTVDNKYVYHFESYNSGAYSGNHVCTLRCFDEIRKTLSGDYRYDSPVIREIEANTIGLETRNDWGWDNIIGGKIDIDKLVSQSK